MIDLPAILYKSPGNFKHPRGKTYKTTGATTPEELERLLSTGWFATFEQATDDAGDAAYGTPPKVAKWRLLKKFKKKKKPAKPLGVKVAPAPAPEVSTDETAPPTRLELEIKALELGIKFDGRTTDKRLLEKISETLKG